MFQRERWVLLNDGPGCSWWPTPLAGNDSHGVGYQRSRQAGGTVTNWPTLTGAARMAAGLPMQTPGESLNPFFVEWLMGFPIGWTDLEPSETP